MDPKNPAGQSQMVLVKVLDMKGLYRPQCCLGRAKKKSGRKVVEILKKNPKKDPSKYSEEDVQHMRRVAAYNKRHRML